MKKYEYGGMIYCDEDLSCKIDNYGGDLISLFIELKRNDNVQEITTYYCPQSNAYYDSIDEFIENECEDLEVE
jgi:hypothetical protein